MADSADPVKELQKREEATRAALETLVGLLVNAGSLSQRDRAGVLATLNGKRK